MDVELIIAFRPVQVHVRMQDMAVSWFLIYYCEIDNKQCTAIIKRPHEIKNKI